MRLKTHSQLRQIEWGLTNTWDITIQDTHGPELTGKFRNNFFPAKSITLNEINPNVTNHNLNDWTFPIFSGKTGAKDLTITAYDDADQSLYNWYKSWVEYCSGGSVNKNGLLESSITDVSRYLDESYKTIVIIPKKRQSSSSMKDLSSKTFKIIPSGSLSWSRDDAAEVVTLSMSFLIIG